MHKKSVSQRCSLTGVLRQIREQGFSPGTIIDVGAAYGEFALESYPIFPNSKYVLIEPLVEYKTNLEKLTKNIPNVKYEYAAADSTSGQVTINVHPDLVGSSMYLEQEESNVNGIPRIVPTKALDDICKEENLTGPYLIKIDTQGAELKVLSGARRIMNETEYIILEVSLFEFFKGGPLIHDVIDYMKASGFVAYDIFGLQYRLLDNAMSQIDIAFVKENSEFRKYQYYATPKQRIDQTKRFLKQK